MGAAAVPIMVGATLVSAYGQYEQNRARAKAEHANAAYYTEQAKNAQMASKRELEIYIRESNQVIGAQIGAFAKAGVDFTGSPLLKYLESKSVQLSEIQAIKQEGFQRARVARMRAQAADDTANKMSSFGYNFLTVGGPILSGVGQIAPYMKPGASDTMRSPTSSLLYSENFGVGSRSPSGGIS